ncbi:MAG: helix-turn-helix transcriptional regulator [Clostridia bacterium]|nr:helix-turn-helix transcriptional regulator [Clostridia bacterium]
MTTSDLVRKLCEEEKISLAELARRIGQSRQNVCKKLQRETLTLTELKAISDALGVIFEQSFTLPNGERLQI